LDAVGYINTNNAYKINGDNVLYASSTNFSTLVGIGAGAALLPGGLNNTVLGYQALNVATSSDSNTAVGSYSLSSNTSGNHNTAYGDQALNMNTSGIQNTAIGYNSLFYNSTGSNNIAVGGSALAGFVSPGAYENNVALGYKAGMSSFPGSDNNIFIGYQAGVNMQNGDNNIIIGYNVNVQGGDNSNVLNIGNLIFGTGIDGTGETLSSGNIGIGTSTPSAKLTVGATSNSQFLVNNVGQITDGEWLGDTIGLGYGGTGNTSFTNGSIVFSNGTILTEDNSNFFWDDTNNRLGIGTSTIYLPFK